MSQFLAALIVAAPVVLLAGTGCGWTYLPALGIRIWPPRRRRHTPPAVHRPAPSWAVR